MSEACPLACNTCRSRGDGAVFSQNIEGQSKNTVVSLIDVDYDCEEDGACLTCAGVHRCQVCQDGALRLRSQCVTAETCVDEGRIPMIGSSHAGGKCIPDGL